MSDLAPDVPFADDDLAAWIRRHPESWHTGGINQVSNASIDRMIDATFTRARKRQAGRRRKVLGGAFVVLTLAGGAVGAAALLRSGETSAPEAGAACRAAARLDADAIVLDPGADALEGCSRLWADGRFSDDNSQGLVPALAACIGSNGVVEVFPGKPGVCSSLGLVAAEPQFSSENAAVLAVQDRLIAEINAAGCRSVDQAVSVAKDILTASPLKGWTVTVEPGSESGSCAKAAVDSPTQRIVISKL